MIVMPDRERTIKTLMILALMHILAEQDDEPSRSDTWETAR